MDDFKENECNIQIDLLATERFEEFYLFQTGRYKHLFTDFKFVNDADIKCFVRVISNNLYWFKKIIDGDASSDYYTRTNFNEIFEKYIPNAHKADCLFHLDIFMKYSK